MQRRGLFRTNGGISNLANPAVRLVNCAGTATKTFIRLNDTVSFSATGV